MNNYFAASSWPAIVPMDLSTTFIFSEVFRHLNSNIYLTPHQSMLKLTHYRYLPIRSSL